MANTQISTAISVLGELFQTGKRPNTLLVMMGGIQGNVQTTSGREFPTNVLYSLRAPAQTVRLEGAAAPAAENVNVSQATNVVQIHQETVKLTYLADSDNTVTGPVPIPQASANGPVVNARSEAFQVMARMETIQRDINYSFHRGTFANPADPSGTALRTRGLLTAITTNAVDVSAAAIVGDGKAQYRGYVNQLLKAIVVATGYNPDQYYYIFADATEFGNICEAYAAQGTAFLSPDSTQFGLQVRTIKTNFGTINVVMDPDMPAQTLAIYDLRVVAPVILPVPGKGLIFMEPLAKVGSSNDMQIYGQIGLDHGPEHLHGKITLPAFSF